MIVYIVTGSENNGYLYAPFAFQDREDAIRKMEEQANEERDFQEQENDEVLEILFSEDGEQVSLEDENGNTRFLFEVNKVEMK